MRTLLHFLAWNWSTGLLIAGLVVMAGYTWVNRFKNPSKTCLFLAGLVLAEVALALPLGPTPPGFQQASAFSCALPGGTLFSMHMARHIILLMLAPPLMVAGLPERPLRRFLSKSHLKPILNKIAHPYITWPLGVGIMWFWHVPPIYNYLTTYGTGLGHLLIPYVEIISLLGIGLLYCWPILSPLHEYRLPALKGIVYLFLACVGCSLLGILLTFSAPGLYHTAFSSGAPIIWDMTAVTDQQVGGLLMWVPGCLIYLTGVITLLVRWFSRTEISAPAQAEQTVTVQY